MKLSHQIMDDVWKSEQLANKHEYVGNAHEIRIHPDKFYELMREPDIFKNVYFLNSHCRLNGIPIMQDHKIDRWEIRI